jgi:hypothetical protein
MEKMDVKRDIPPQPETHPLSTQQPLSLWVLISSLKNKNK